MPGRHRGPIVLGPGFISQPIRHGNRNRAGNRQGTLGSTLLLLPDDARAEQGGRYTGRHRERGGHQRA